MEALLGVCCILLAYVSGSFPFGFWFAKLFRGKDFDIRDWGSGNIGFTNVLRNLGWQVALPVMIFDIAKGYLPAFLCLQLNLGSTIWPILVVLVAGFGHAYSIYFYFREGMLGGGKSVATFFGGILAVQPGLTLGCLLVFLAVLLITRYLSLASMLAAASCIPISLALGLGPAWVVLSALITLALLVTHRRNINRLIEHCEPKFTGRQGVHGTDPKSVTVAFCVHPLTAADYKQSPISKHLPRLLDHPLSSRAMNWIIERGLVVEAPSITGIITPPKLDSSGQDNGSIEVKVLIFSVPLLPERLLNKNPQNQLLLEAFLRSYAVQAKRRGATVAGLGALLSSCTDKGGLTLQTWCKQRGLNIQIDNGAAYTAVAALEALYEQVGPSRLHNKTVAIIGATGLIGWAMTQHIKNAVGRLDVYVRSPEMKKSRIRGLTELGLVYDSESAELKHLAEADVVICTASLEKPILNLENWDLLKKGCIVVDVGIPVNFADELLEVRPDLVLIRAGLIRLPGEPKCGIDFHFGRAPDGAPYFPACTAQAALLGLTGQYQHASLAANVTEEAMDHLSWAAETFGFKVDRSKISEPTLYGKIAHGGKTPMESPP